MTIINIIPSDYNGDHKKALGYAWQDYDTKTPGIDVIVDNTWSGIDYMAAALAKMAEIGVTMAYINCMWCGGFSGEITAAEELREIEQPAPLSAEEVAVTEHNFEHTELADQDRRNENHQGYCPKCHTYCCGDCETNQKNERVMKTTIILTNDIHNTQTTAIADLWETELGEKMASIDHYDALQVGRRLCGIKQCTCGGWRGKGVDDDGNAYSVCIA